MSQDFLLLKYRCLQNNLFEYSNKVIETYSKTFLDFKDYLIKKTK